MQQIIELLETNMVYIIIGLIGITIVLLILMIMLLVKNKNLKNRYNEFMSGEATNIEELLREAINKTADVQEHYNYIRESVEESQRQLEKCIQKVGLIRYNAIDGPGPELSFAIALLDQGDNGLVINGIYTSEGSYTYAKKIVASESNHLLSDEEKEAIIMAKQII